MKRAEITVFLSMVLILIVSFILGIIQITVIHTSKNMSRLETDRAVFSLFGEYHRTLFEDYHVFSIEGNAFTTYYGESMKLRTVHGVSPIGSEIRLSDGHKQASPLALFNSGKKTDAPVISALCPWKPQEKLYFCFYQRGDYNYFMLPGLFGKEHKTRSK